MRGGSDAAERTYELNSMGCCAVVSRAECAGYAGGEKGRSGDFGRDIAG
jgi:hypothetical protein